MSETYTTGGDTLIKCDHPNWQGQTFRPIEDHTLEYIDLNMRGLLTSPEPVIEVFRADGNHQPYGIYLSRNRFTVEKHCSLLTTGRVRFSMTPCPLNAGDYYVILISNFPSLFENSAYLQYDKDNATYPRGLRISTADGGTTWTKHYNDDFIFAEFGNPPLPKPEPPPPINHFAIPDIQQFYTQTTIKIIISTTVPCHLTCYYTDKEPWTHQLSRTVRGLTVPWSTYFCFVAWKAIEQTEPGDTLYHTFEIPEWEVCQTKWFTFRGTIDEVLSPSVGPIFKKHHPGAPITKAFYAKTSDGDIRTPTGISNYLQAHQLIQGYVVASSETFSVGQQYTSFMYIIYRTGLFFDTSTIPGNAQILSATLTYRIYSVGGLPYNIIIVSGDNLSEPLEPHHYHNLLDEIKSHGSAPAVSAGRWQNIELNTLGLGKINKKGITKLALRTDKEIAAIPPTWFQNQRIYAAESNYKPYLTITYQPL